MPSFSYDNDGRMTKAGDTTATYNADSQVATLTQSPPGNPAANTTTLSYDTAGRLTSAALARNGTTVSTATYSWDADSNRATAAVTGHPAVTTSYNLADQATTDTTGATYAYNPNGALKAITAPGGTTSYGYDPFGDLTSAATPSGSATYTPDALGRTAARTSAGTTQQLSYDGTTTLLAAQQSGAAVTSLVRDPTGRLLAEAPAGGDPLAAFPDIHGDITRLADMNTYASTWTAVYDPFGSDTSATTGTAPASLGFQSMYADPATGLTDMAARWYSPASGTFTTADTLAGDLASPPTLNRYLYGTGDPVNSFDPDGHCSWWSCVTTALDTLASWASQAWDTAVTATSQAVGDIAQTYQSVTSDLATAYHQATAAVQANLPAIRATTASLAVGGAVFLGCEALTAGAGSLGCEAASGAAGGAVYGAMMCPQGTSTLHCAATGALAGTIAGTAGGIAADLGLGAVAAGAIASGAGSAASQYLTTGHVSPAQVATAALTGAALGYASSKLLASTTDTLLGRIGTSSDTTTTTSDTAIPSPADTTAADTATPASPQPETDPASPASPATRSPGPTPEGPAAEDVPSTLYHYTSSANAPRIIASGKIDASGADVPNGPGVFLTDIPPEDILPGKSADISAEDAAAGKMSIYQLARRIMGRQWNWPKATYYFQVDVSGLPVQRVIDRAVSNVYKIPGNDPLWLDPSWPHGEVGAP